MPIYEYRCEKGHRFDVMHSMSDEPVAACEVCGVPVQKVLHAPAVHFKGSGFYTTDYGKKGAGNAGDAKKGKAESNGSLGGSDSGSPSGSDSGSTSKKPEPKSGSGAKPD
jgi:putative FmdB family regulatory protein